MFINMEFLVIFGAPWNKRGRWVLSGTGVSGCKSKDLLPLLTLCDFQGSNDQVIEEVNSYVSCWISKVASTGFYYDLENKIIAAIKPRPAFLPVLRMLGGVIEFDETRGLLLVEHWCDRNRRDSNPRSSA